MYVIDTSALFDLKNGYPRDVPVFQPIWDRMSSLAADGVLIAPRDAFREVERGSDDAAVWVRLHESMFVEIDPELGLIMGEVWRECPAIDRDKAGPHADPWCVALALREVRRGNEVHVITHEHARSAGRIPRACRAFDIPCIKLIEFFRMENWSLGGAAR